MWLRCILPHVLPPIRNQRCPQGGRSWLLHQEEYGNLVQQRRLGTGRWAFRLGLGLSLPAVALDLPVVPLHLRPTPPVLSTEQACSPLGGATLRKVTSWCYSGLVPICRVMAGTHGWREADCVEDTGRPPAAVHAGQASVSLPSLPRQPWSLLYPLPTVREGDFLLRSDPQSLFNISRGTAASPPRSPQWVWDPRRLQRGGETLGEGYPIKDTVITMAVSAGFCSS